MAHFFGGWSQGEKLSNSKPNLKAHNYQSHGDRQKCAHCEKSFLNGFILKRHLVFDHGIKNGALFCDKCPKKVFFEEVFLKRHIQGKHSL